MQNMVVEENGKLRRADDIELAEKIIELRQKKDHWAVIGALIDAWVKRAPAEVKAVKIDVTDQRELLVDKKFGQTLGGKQMERRFQLLFPSQLQLMIRTQYKAEELPFDKAFFREFGKRFPAFRVAEKD